MAVASGARGLADRFNRNRRDVQGPEGAERNRGFLGSDGDDRDPIAPRGLLDQAQAAIGANPIREGGGRVTPDRDERPPRGPSEAEDAPPLLPGDPSNLGARGRRRRNSDDDDASPVLRRGLLGV